MLLFSKFYALKYCRRQVIRCHVFENPLKLKDHYPIDITTAITYVIPMTTLTATKARSALYKLIDKAAESHEPIQITGKRSNAILVSEEDWKSIQETVYLLSIPGMRKSIRKGLATPIEKCSKKLRW
jgi:antitoxin YefM